MHNAAREGHADVVTLLLEAGADKTALELAEYYKRAEAAAVLRAAL